MNYQQYFKKEIEAIIDREITAGDGLPKKQLDDLLNKAKIKIPTSLYHYYLTCENLEINKEYHNLYHPGEYEFISHYEIAYSLPGDVLEQIEINCFIREDV